METPNFLTVPLQPRKWVKGVYFCTNWPKKSLTLPSGKTSRESVVKRIVGTSICLKICYILENWIWASVVVNFACWFEWTKTHRALKGTSFVFPWGLVHGVLTSSESEWYHLLFKNSTLNIMGKGKLLVYIPFTLLPDSPKIWEITLPHHNSWPPLNNSIPQIMSWNLCICLYISGIQASIHE